VHVGLYGDLARGIADVGWAGLFAAENRRGVLDFLDWYQLENVIFMTLAPVGQQDEILALIRAFDWYTWLALFAWFALGIFAMVWVMRKGLTHHFGSNLLVYIVNVVFGQSHKSGKVSTKTSLRYTLLFKYSLIYSSCILSRIGLGALSWSFLVMSAAYSGSLISFLSVTILPPPANTFDEVASLAEINDMDVAICCDFVKHAMGASTLPSFKKLSKRVRIM